MKTIKLTRGKVAIVDDELFDYLNQWKWFCINNGYAVRSTQNSAGKRCVIQMHRLILNTPKGLYTDHINGNKLDNRIQNLRVSSRAENMRNRFKFSNNKSGYKGVSWKKKNKKWVAQIKHENKVIYLGLFTSVIEAAQAYNSAAIKLQGSFAKLNIIEKDSSDEI